LTDWNGLIVKPVFKLLQLAAVATMVAAASPALAVTDIMLWHAMSGELGRQLEKLASDFNASQSEYRIVPGYKLMNPLIFRWCHKRRQTWGFRAA
jgi:sn-glycerol 3-phosphate transport system substrate-binding protein